MPNEFERRLQPNGEILWTCKVCRQSFVGQKPREHGCAYNDERRTPVSGGIKNPVPNNLYGNNVLNAPPVHQNVNTPSLAQILGLRENAFQTPYAQHLSHGVASLPNPPRIP